MFVCAIAMAAPAAYAQQPQQPQKEHVVRKGDTLWDLAAFYYGDPFRWPVIYEANRGIVENPHWIFPREKLVIIIPSLPAKPAVADTTAPAQPPQIVAEPEPEPEPANPNRSRFYVAPSAEPAEPTVISSERQANAIIQPMEYIAAPWIADSASIGINGRVIQAVDPRSAEDVLAQTFHPRDKLYISARGSVGERLMVVRLTRVLRPYGWLVEPMGIIRIDTVGARAARAIITHQFSDLKVGDLTIPLPPVPALPTEDPRTVTGGATGRIIDFLAPQPLYGTTEIGFIDLGSAKGMHIGDEVVAFLPERQPTKTRAEVLPEEPVAKMVVVKLTQNTATVRVTRLRYSALNPNMPVRVSKQTR